MLSTNRHVGFNLEAELDDARAEIQTLRATISALQRSLHEQREHYEKQIADLKAVGRHLVDSLDKAHPEYRSRPPPPPSSLNQQVAQTNPYAIT